MASVRKRKWAAPKTGTACAWVVDWTDRDGKRRSRQFARKAEAEAHRDQVAQQTRQGVATAASRRGTVEQAGQSWLAQRKLDDLEPTTLAAYEQHLRLHIGPVCGARKFNQITALEAERIRDELVAKLSRAMATRVLRTLRAIGSEAKRIGLSAFNVFEDLRTKRARRHEPKVVIPLKGELKALIRLAAMMPNPMTLPLILLLMFCGLRASEARGLAWNAIDLKRGTVTISQRADAKNVIGPPKTQAGYRTIALPRRALAALRAWRLACPRTKLNLVFPSVRGRVMSHAYMNKTIFGTLQIAAGLFEEEITPSGVVMVQRYTLHTLRHTAASLWIERGVTPLQVRTWMGHSSIQVTFDIYGHLFEQAKLDGAAAGEIEDELMGYLDAA